MFGKTIAPVAGALALLAASQPAGATLIASGRGEAVSGSLRVVSTVAATHGQVLLRGGWMDQTLDCSVFRGLRIGAILRFENLRGTLKRTMTRGRKGAVRNCTGESPNFGFRIRASDTVPRPEGHHPHLSLACANGRWRSGSYSFTVRTTHRLTMVSSVATVTWVNAEPCPRRNG